MFARDLSLSIIKEMGEVNEVHAGARENLDVIAIDEVFLYIIK